MVVISKKMVKVGKFLSVFTLSGLLIGGPLVDSAAIGNRIAFAEENKDKDKEKDKDKDKDKDKSKDKDKDKDSTTEKAGASEGSSGGKEDSIDRIKNYLKLAAAKQGGDGGKAKGMTALEIKTAGFFMSNFYTPYVTKVGSDSSLSKDDIVTALKDGAGISESFAKDLGGKISATMKQAEGLRLVVSQDGGKTWRAVGDATYYDVLAGMTGMMMSQDARVIAGASFYANSGDKYGFSWYKRLGLDLSKDKTGVDGLDAQDMNADTTRGKFKEYSEKKQFYMGLSTADGNSIERRQVIMDWNPLVQYGGEATPTQALFYRNLQKINPKNTVGASVLSMVRDWSDGNDAYKGIATSDKPVTDFKEKGKHSDFEFLYKSSMFSWRMLEDAFGNVLMQTGGHENEATYVVMPASQNPFMFAKKGEGTSSPSSDSDDKDKKDEDKKKNTSSGGSSGGGGAQVDGATSYNPNGPNIAERSRTKKEKEGGTAENKKDKKDKDKEKDKDKDKDSESSDDAKDSNGGVSAGEYDQWLNNILNDEVNGAGKNLPINNLNTLALINEGGFINWTDTFNYGSGLDDLHKNLSVITGTTRKDWDEGNGQDWGTTSWDMLLSQYSAKNLGKSNDGKASEGMKKLNITSGGDYLSYGKSPGGDVDLGRSDFSDLQDSWGAKAGSDDASPFMGDNAWAKSGVIHEITAFDNFDLNKAAEGYGDPGSVIKTSYIFKEGGTEVAMNDKDTGKLSGGFWQGVGTAGKIANSFKTSAGSTNYAANFFVTYLIVTAKPTDDEVKFVINFSNTPDLDTNAGEDGDGNANDAILKNMAYYMLNPTLGREYKQRWSKTFLNSILLQSHQDMVGSNNSNVNSGRTRYLEMSGFATVPNLDEVSFTAYLYENFTTWGVFLIGFALIVLVIFVAIGQVTFTSAVMSLLMFGVMLYVPPKLLNTAINTTNTISNSFYKDKFMFWALYSHQNYVDSVSDLKESGDAGDTGTYNKILNIIQGGDGENDNTKRGGLYEWQTQLGASVKIRWMSPKKDGYIEQALRDTESKTEEKMSDGMGALTESLLGKSISKEEFLEDVDAAYLYRGYTDIADYSRFYYGNIMGDNYSGNGSVNHTIGSWESALSKIFPVTEGDNRRDRVSIMDYLQGTEQGSLYERKKLGFINDRGKGIEAGADNLSKLKRIYAPISSDTVSKMSNFDVNKVRVGDEVGLDKNYFMATIRDFNNHSKAFNEILADLNKDHGGQTLESGDAVSLSTFAIFTESPFYYFSWSLYDNGLKTEDGSSGEFKKMMLENNDAFFYNYEIEAGKSGYGSMKDFLDLGSMFRVTIPYLKEANKPLLAWSNKFGTKPYKGYSAKAESLKAIEEKSSEEFYKTWFNVSLDNLFRTYSPWVDVMQDLDIAGKEEIEYGGQKEVVEEPLNPASYHIRPMVFSRSEMDFYGLKEADLTRVEKAIIKTLDDTRRDWLQLMNYTQLDDTVLNTSASMIATFNFNKNFSQTSWWQKNYVMEPQGFDLRQFSYDGYLRLILQNASGESIFYNKDLKSDIYEIIAERGGTGTALILWVQSFVAVYVIPTLRMLMLVLLPIGILLSVIASFVRRDNGYAKMLARDILMPFFAFLGITLLMAFVISKMMGDAGNSLVVDTGAGSINFKDPSTTLMMLLVFCLAVAYGYYLAVRRVLTSVFRNAKLISIPVKGVVEKITVNTVGGAVQKISDAVDSEAARARSSEVPRDRRAGNMSTDELSNLNMEGASRNRFGFTKLSKRADGRHGGSSTESLAKEVNSILEEDDGVGRKKKGVTFEDLVKEEESKRVAKEVSEILKEEPKKDELKPEKDVKKDKDKDK